MMSIPGWIYLVMGAVIARIMLGGTQTRGYGLLEWFQLLFNILRIVLLWPLVLFAEKIELWLKTEPKLVVEAPVELFPESWPLENAIPVPVTGAME